ncbi:MAG: M64 family metallopeptidase [Bacteroidales bacterium]
MKTLILTLTLTLLCATQTFANDFYNKHFTAERLRIDYYMHAQKDTIEVEIKNSLREPRWAGVKNENLRKAFGGNFKYRLVEVDSGELIYESGFNSMVEEWQSSDLDEKKRRFEMVAILPCPKQDVNFEIWQWDMNKGSYVFVYSQHIEIDRVKTTNLKSDLRIKHINFKEDTDSSVEFVILSEGYTEKEEKEFFKHCEYFKEYLFETSPFDTLRHKFRIKTIFVPSEESGTSMLDGRTKRKTNFGSSFYTFGEARYLTTSSMFDLHNAIANVDYDYIIVFVNTERYGGAGFYNTYAITSTRNANSKEVFVHEFGHSFAGLADEYFYEHDDVLDAMYDKTVEPWEANITSLVNFSSKWEDMANNPKTDSSKFGLFEGAGYLTKGMYRAEDNCKMRELGHPFCAVCRRHILDVINYNIGKKCTR